MLEIPLKFGPIQNTCPSVHLIIHEKMSFWRYATAARSERSSQLAGLLGHSGPKGRSQNAADVEEALRFLMASRCDQKAITRVLASQPTGKKGRGKRVAWHRYLNSECNKTLATDLLTLNDEFDLQKISTYIRKGGFEEEIAREALAHWKSLTPAELPFQTVMEQAKAYTSKVFDPTEVQHKIFNLLKPSSGNFAELIVAPTASGKTSGLAAAISAMVHGKQTEAQTLTVLSPISGTAMEEFIAVMSAASIPFCIARRREGRIQIVPSRETMGSVSGDRPSSIIQMTRTMVADRSKYKRGRSKRFTNAFPSLIICESSFREDGLSDVVQMSREFVTEYSERYGDLTVFVDDFGASNHDVTHGVDVLRVMESEKRIVLMTATPPSNLDASERKINIKRRSSGLDEFTEHIYTNTLGQGLDLVVEGGSPFTILDHDLSVFETSPFALQTLSLSSTIFLLQRIYGELGARDMVLDMLPVVSLDTLRKAVVDGLKGMTGSVRQNLIDQAKAVHVVLPSLKGKQTLVLDEDPLKRAQDDGYTFDLGRDTAHGSGWLRELRRYVEAHGKILDKEAALIEEMKSKSLEEALKRPPIPFEFAGLNRRLTYRAVKAFLSVAEDCEVPDEEVCIMLQKNILVVTRTTPTGWIHTVTEQARPTTIFGDVRVMGIGVHMPDLTKVYLPRQDIPTELLIQAIGRVGRPSQGVGTVYGTRAQFDQAFDTTYGTEITSALDALYDVLHPSAPVVAAVPVAAEAPVAPASSSAPAPAVVEAEVEVPEPPTTIVRTLSVSGDADDVDGWDDDDVDLIGIPKTVIAAPVAAPAPAVDSTPAVNPSQESSKDDDDSSEVASTVGSETSHKSGTRSNAAKSDRRKKYRQRKRAKKRGKR